jgi:PKD repeat protein
MCSTVEICYPVIADFQSTVSGADVTFIDTSVDAIIASWDFGDGNTSTDIDPTHVYTVNGNYSVCLIASGACSADTICNTVTVCPETLLAGYTLSGTDLNYDFTSTSEGMSDYLWNFGDGTTSTDESPAHVYPTSGPYTVCLKVMNVCGDSAVICNTITITVTGINELAGVSSIEVYPNPFSEYTTILVQSTSLEDQYTVEIMDVTGKTVSVQQGSFNQETVIQKNNITPDLYFYRITQNGVKLGTGKLIVQ